METSYQKGQVLIETVILISLFAVFIISSKHLHQISLQQIKEINYENIRKN